MSTLVLLVKNQRIVVSRDFLTYCTALPIQSSEISLPGDYHIPSLRRLDLVFSATNRRALLAAFTETARQNLQITARQLGALV